VSEHIPRANAERASERANIGGVVLDRRVGRVSGSRRPAASTLVVEDDLAACGER
jgi:hypothetical protein